MIILEVRYAYFFGRESRSEAYSGNEEKLPRLVREVRSVID